MFPIVKIISIDIATSLVRNMKLCIRTMFTVQYNYRNLCHRIEWYDKVSQGDKDNKQILKLLNIFSSQVILLSCS